MKTETNGTWVTGYNYNLQVWLKNGIIQNCGHLKTGICCNQKKYSGMTMDEAEKAIAKAERGD